MQRTIMTCIGTHGLQVGSIVAQSPAPIGTRWSRLVRLLRKRPTVFVIVELTDTTLTCESVPMPVSLWLRRVWRELVCEP